MFDSNLINVRMLDPARGIDASVDITIRNGIIISCKPAAGSGKMRYIVTPGLRDVHVHFRDPGDTDSETIETGAAAAAAGGFTCVTTMPNTNPAGDSVEWLRTQIEQTSLPVRIAPSACITKGRAGKECADLEALAKAGAAAFTDDGSTVPDSNVLFEAMERAAALGVPVMDHAVLPGFLQGGVIRECPAAVKFNLKTMPIEAETKAIERDIELARRTGCRLHIQHISTAEGVELVRRAKKEGLKVSAEATPHHLALSADDIPCDDANWKMAPPLGSRADVKALRRGVMDGTLELFATDHAPHCAAKKRGGFQSGANGIVGLETAAAVTWETMVQEEGMAPLEWARRWCRAPALLIGEKPASLSEGAMADFAVFDTMAHYTVNPESFKSKSRNTPFSGMEFSLQPVATVFNGRIVYGHEFLQQAF